MPWRRVAERQKHQELITTDPDAAFLAFFEVECGEVERGRGIVVLVAPEDTERIPGRCLRPLCPRIAAGEERAVQESIIVVPHERLVPRPITLTLDLVFEPALGLGEQSVGTLLEHA